MIIAVIAIDENGGVGNNGGMPWPPNTDDFKWFRSTTIDQVVVMGKTTWLSPDMPKPLPKRTNVVCTTSDLIVPPDVIVLNGDIAEGLTNLQHTYLDKNIIVIGGVNIVWQALTVLEKIYITRIPGTYSSDTSIDVVKFLQYFKCIQTIELGSCKVEEYEAI